METTKRCDQPAKFEYYWPGQPARYICAEHYLGLVNIANAMGFYLHIKLAGKNAKCDQQVKVEAENELHAK